MSAIATPTERFADVPGYDYEPQYVAEVDGSADMAYVDVGSGKETFLCLHGEPTWGYLYRKMIPELRTKGRVVVPDFIGFGRSDKYTEIDKYSFGMHYDALSEFIETLDLSDITLIGQDWGGVLGLPVAVLDHPDRVARLVPMNTGVPTGGGGMIDAWWAFREYMAETTDPPISTVIRALGDMAYYHDQAEQPEPWVAPVERGDAGLDFGPEVAAAYDAPFHTPAAKAGARQWPSLVPTDPDMDGADIGKRAVEALAQWDKPTFVLYSDRDPITRGGRNSLRELVPSADAQPDVWMNGVGHFLQEEAGEAVAEEILAFVDRT